MIRTLAAILALSCSALPAHAAPGDTAEAKRLLMDSVGIASVKGRGQTPALARFYRDWLVKAGFNAADIQIDELAGTANFHMVWRAAKAKARPMALTGHLDVVEANPADWERPPFTAIAEQGYIFGRGVQDNKFDVAVLIATLAQLKASGFKPRRDIHLFLSGDEETDGIASAAQAKQAKAFDIEFMLNSDGGGGGLDADGKPYFYRLQAAEKSYADFQMTITDPGGHSSTPTGSNAIARIGLVAARIAGHRWKAEVNDITRASLAEAARQRSDALGQAMARFAANPADADAIAVLRANPGTIGQIGTTCVPTMINGGHAPNALPQRVTLTVNCRIFPGTSIAAVQTELARIAEDPGVTFATGVDWPVTPASPLRPDVTAAVQAAVSARAPGLNATPGMDAGATDSVFWRALGIPSYGVSGLFMRQADSFAHGLNERVPESAIAPALRHWDIILRRLAG
ncbi:M20/M25/M40 family metallo-hydrolase [Sandarakinorhabdus sp. AAP62]|uniref:M20/M25/M40 family metallo-hydrolase n=1 Tax=Sandarakinorhabdus sp. AAP62 TaxID=1248916 RepID=UPI000307AA76|nr:M20/M25/M40 family metallo-hydrolase [Sandarakinorhabdus sp. AAP62]